MNTPQDLIVELTDDSSTYDTVGENVIDDLAYDMMLDPNEMIGDYNV